MNRKLFAIVLLVSAAVAFAGNPDRVPAGYDNWVTIGGGATFMDFADEPIPADFFCAGSATFDGRMNFEGIPLASDPPGALGVTDTIVERLDDAVFTDGEAMSRLRVKAMHLESRDLFDSACGSWAVRAGLAKTQPTTTIVYRQLDDMAGTFDAEIVINVQLTFTNIDDPTDVRVMERTVHFAELLQAPYSFSKIANGPSAPERVMGKRSAQRQVMVDTNADNLPDTALKAQVNNNNGWHYYQGWACPAGAWPPDPSCVWWASVHTAPTHAHVTIPDAPCDEQEYEHAEPIDNVATRVTISGQTVLEAERPCAQKLSPAQITALRDQLGQMEGDGRLVIPSDQLLDELVRKVEDQ